jgi:glycerol uptake facilitator-like aquaporin
MERPHARAWFSEFAGTTILLFASVLVTRWVFGPQSALASAVPGLPGRMAVVGAAIGAVIGLLIISPLGRSSGGHFNPAVTVTFWLLRSLPGRDAIAYIAGQLAGSLAGVMLGRAVLGAVVANPAVDYAAIQPAAGWSGSAVFAGEAISLAALMAFVVAFLDRPALMRWTPAVVAAGVAVLIFAGELTSGGSFNPARQLGPLLFAGRFTYLWAYLLGPLAGALILVAAVRAAGLPRPLTCSLCGVPLRDAAPTPAPHRGTDGPGARRGKHDTHRKRGPAPWTAEPALHRYPESELNACAATTAASRPPTTNADTSPAKITAWHGCSGAAIPRP